MDERHDCSSDQDMKSGPVEGLPLDDNSPPDDKIRPDDKVRPDDEFRSYDRISPNVDERTGVVEVAADDKVRLNEEVRLDDINVSNEDVPNKPLPSEVNPDSEGECTVKGDIFESAQSGDMQTVKKYLGLGIPPDLVDEQGWSILHHAASHGQVDMMRLLHSKGCCVDPRDTHGRTPLHYAASSGACASIGVLVEELGSEVNPVDEDGFTPLKWSVVCEQYAVEEELLRCGGVVFLDEDSKAMLFQAAETGDVQHVLAILDSGWRPIDVVDSNCWSALHFAAEDGAVEMIHFLIKSGLDVNRGDKTGRTALHVAAKYGHQEVVSTLVDAGCPIDVEDSEGWSALHWAALDGVVEMITFLIKCGSDMIRRDKIGRTALHLATQYGHQEIVSTLVDAGCPIDVVDSDGWIALHFAACVGSVEMIYFLIKCGLDVNRRDKTGRTALHLAAQYGHQEIVSTLVDAGCPIDVVDSDGWIALHWAACSGSVEMIHFLIKCGLDVNRRDKTGKTALHLAARYGHQEVVSTLVDAGCPIDVVDSDGWIALHFAACVGSVEMIHFLIKCGLDMNRRDKTGKTALHLAARYGHQEVVSTLVDAGCPIDVVDSNGCNALHWAAGGGGAQMISFLMEGKHCFDVNDKDKNGITPLHAACSSCQSQAAFQLLSHGALLTKVAGRYGTPIHQAAVQDDASSLIDDVLKFQSNMQRLYSGVTANSGYPESTNPLDVCDSFGRPPAFGAASRGCIANLERLVANNCDIRVRSNIKFSIFEHAIIGGRMSQLQAIANACRVDAGSTCQIDLLHALHAKDLLDPSKLLILGAIGGDPLVIDSLSSEGDIFTAAAHQVWSSTYFKMLLLDFFFSDDDKDVIYDCLCLPSACPLTPLQIAVIFLKYRTEYQREDEFEMKTIASTPEFIQKLITHPVSMFIVNVQFHNGLSPLDVAQQFGLHKIADMIESAGGRPGMWADLPKEVQIPAMKLYCSKHGRHLSSHGPTGLAALSRVFEGWIGVSPQLQHKSELVNQQTSVDAALHQMPTRKLLIKHVLNRVMMKQKWRNLYILLDLKEDQVLKYRDQDDDDPYQAVLFAWLEHGCQVSWHSLFDALDSFETGKTVKDIRTKVLEELQCSAVSSPPTPSSVLMPLPHLPTLGVQTLGLSRPALHRSKEALLPHQRLMGRYRDRLLEVVPAKELVLRWYNHQLVSDEVYYRINPENVTPCKARNILFRYFWDHGTEQTFEKAFCQIMVKEGQEGYHQAAQLGRDMLEELSQLEPQH